MTIFFTSDTHFGHTNVIKHCNRPFESAVEMDAALITNWNSVVKPTDEVWHLGDFCWGRHASGYRAYLNGRIHLVYGNHDPKEVRNHPGWASSQPIAEITAGGYKVTLCHYAMKVWNKSHYGALMLYGHSHGTLPGDGQSTDVGVDCWNYRPVRLAEILERMRTAAPHRTVDHHESGEPFTGP